MPNRTVLTRPEFNAKAALLVLNRVPQEGVSLFDLVSQATREWYENYEKDFETVEGDAWFWFRVDLVAFARGYDSADRLHWMTNIKSQWHIEEHLRGFMQEQLRLAELNKAKSEGAET